MAKLVVFSVRDSAVNGFMTPFFAAMRGGAIRAFQDEVTRPESPMGKHPADYELYSLCMFDDETGEFSDQSPEMLIRAQDCVKGD